MKNNLQVIRENAGYTLQQLGYMCGCHRMHIFNLQKENSSPTLLTAYRIAKVLDREITDIWPNTVEVEKEVTVMLVAKR